MADITISTDHYKPAPKSQTLLQPLFDHELFQEEQKPVPQNRHADPSHVIDDDGSANQTTDCQLQLDTEHILTLPRVSFMKEKFHDSQKPKQKRNDPSTSSLNAQTSNLMSSFQHHQDVILFPCRDLPNFTNKPHLDLGLTSEIQIQDSPFGQIVENRRKKQLIKEKERARRRQNGVVMSDATGAASSKSLKFSHYAQQLSQMEMRKRKLHHKYLASRALLNRSVYPKTGQSPRVEYGDKPIRYDKPLIDQLELLIGKHIPKEPEVKVELKDQTTGYKAQTIKKMADLIRKNINSEQILEKTLKKQTIV